MTTKPKAKKFRIRRTSPLVSDGQDGMGPEAAPQDDGFGPERFPTAAPREEVLDPNEVAAETEMDAIRREGLTGRQLRMARRVAQKHDLPATSDFDAVRLLRKAGIDPFQRANLLELVSAEESQGEGTPPQATSGSRELTQMPDANMRLPQTVKPMQVPSTENRAEQSHAADIIRIQRDIANRRRRKSMLLLARLTVFVLLPTLLAGYYYFRVATPLYATKSEFVIQQAESAAASGLGGLFTGTQFATSQDSIAVQGYLQSRDAMQRLDEDIGFRSHFSDPSIDPIQRLDPDASREAAYRLYKRNIKIGYDPTEGIIKMEVMAADPAISAAYSKALISYAEEQVDHLTQRLRGDQMQGARQSYEDAESKMLEAQRRVVELQEKFKVLSSEVEVQLITTQIGQLESQLTQDRLSLQQMLSNPNPNKARLEPLQRRIASVEEEILRMRAKLTEDGIDGISLAKVQSELLVAQADVQTRQLLLSQSLQQLETARIEANRQVRYLSLSVSPVAPDEPTYPRAFEDTLLALMILSGVYLMISMTAAILREQVSA
jgi:capsular polysaccharide transport system permease protein